MVKIWVTLLFLTRCVFTRFRLGRWFLCLVNVHRPIFYMGHGEGGPCCFYCGKTLKNYN